jgi:hypothetical protein
VQKKWFFDNFCKYITPPLAAQNILWGEQFFFCAKAQKKNCSPIKFYRRLRRRLFMQKLSKNQNNYQ